MNKKWTDFSWLSVCLELSQKNKVYLKSSPKDQEITDSQSIWFDNDMPNPAEDVYFTERYRSIAGLKVEKNDYTLLRRHAYFIENVNMFQREATAQN